MNYGGSWKIDDLLTFTVNTHTPSTGARTAADSPPAYRVYEDETATPLLTGSMATLDSGNTTGFYSEQITLSAANGFEKGKSYSIHISAAVGGVTGVTVVNFQIEAEVDANAISDTSTVISANMVQISGDATAADELEAYFDGCRSGTAQTGTATTITLDGSAVATSDYYNGFVCLITAGTGIGQARLIEDYDGTTLIATVAGGWATAPDNTSVFLLIPSHNPWLAASRTLTSTAAQTAAAVDGDDLNVVKAATFSATISSLTIPATWAAMYFTVKPASDLGDADTVAVIQIKESNPADGGDGLLYLNGAAATAANGSLTTNQGAGTVAIVLSDNSTDSLAETGLLCYDLKVLKSDGSSTVLASGNLNISLTPTRTI